MEEFHVILLGKPAQDEDLKSLTPDARVFENKIEALNNLKKWEQCNPRIKSFQTKEEALDSVQNMFKELEEFHVILLGKPAQDEELKSLTPDARVFENKIEALKNMKKWKQCNPRMKTFQNKEDALDSAQNVVLEEEIQTQTNGAPSEGCTFKGLTAQ